MSDLVRRSSELAVIEVIDGELIDAVMWCLRCDTYHTVVGDMLKGCCCGVDHEMDDCCRCGHFHYGEGCKPAGPCGDYRCCINY